MLKLDLTNDAASFLTGQESKQARQLWNKVVSLMKDPRPNDSIDVGEGFFRTTSGEFRIIYRFDQTTLYVFLVGRRGDQDVYRKFERKK